MPAENAGQTILPFSADTLVLETANDLIENGILGFIVEIKLIHGKVVLEKELVEQGGSGCGFSLTTDLLGALVHCLELFDFGHDGIHIAVGPKGVLFHNTVFDLLFAIL